MSWLFRILGFFGGITFIAGGTDIASTADCDSVTFGGTHRQSTYTCFPGSEGEFSAGLAATGMICLGVLLILVAVWPLPKVILQMILFNRREAAMAKTFGITREQWRRHEARAADELIESMTSGPQVSDESMTSGPQLPEATAATPTAKADSGSWRADPTGRYEHRYWNGKAWTVRVRSNDREFTDEID